LSLEINRLGEGGRDGMVGSFALGNETRDAFNSGEGRVFYLPLDDLAEGLAANGRLLGCL
jgi:hypothetical protein